jgi:hypothetical protein
MAMSTRRMPNSNPWFWSCLRKKSYTRREAEQAVEDLGKLGIKLYIYRCENPDRRYHWHVTRQPQS